MIKDFLSILFSGIISSVLVFLTAKLSFRGESKRLIYEKREQVYLECFEIFQSLKDDSYQIYYSEGFISQIECIRARLKLYASPKVLDVVKSFYSIAKKVNSEYSIQFKSEVYEEKKEIYKEQCGMTELDFQNEENTYMETHLISKNLISETIEKLLVEMKKDL